MSAALTVFGAERYPACPRNTGDNDDTTRHLSELRFRVLAFGFAGAELPHLSKEQVQR